MKHKKVEKKLVKKENKLHRKEEKLHHRAEKDMEADERVHKALKKVHKKEEKSVKKESPVSKAKAKKPAKVKKVMEEFKSGKLHSGSKKGPKVTNPKQAIAIGLSEARKAGEKVKPMKKKK